MKCNHLCVYPLLCWMFLASVLSISGCGGDPNAPYIPSAATARDALQAGLEAWKGGKPVAPITRDQGLPTINVFDARWQAGEKLASFEILDEIKGTEHPSFQVKIKTQTKPEETNTYLVVGIDPLLVFRDVDYKKTTGM